MENSGIDFKIIAEGRFESKLFDFNHGYDGFSIIKFIVDGKEYIRINNNIFKTD